MRASGLNPSMFPPSQYRNGRNTIQTMTVRQSFKPSLFPTAPPTVQPLQSCPVLSIKASPTITTSVEVSCLKAHWWPSSKEEGINTSNLRTITRELMAWTSPRERYSKASTDTQQNNSSKAESPSSRPDSSKRLSSQLKGLKCKKSSKAVFRRRS